MNDIFEAILKFQKDSCEPRFIEEQKIVASAINAALSQSYLDDGNEIDLVKSTTPWAITECWQFKQPIPIFFV